MKKQEELFKKHESLANIYAGKVFNQSFIGLDKEDIVQEFRIKLYETILAYDRSIETRKRRGMIKPVPFPYYAKAALNNYVNDYIKKIKDSQSIFVEDSFGNDHDYAQFSDNMVEIDTDRNIFKINDFDLLEPLDGLKRAAFCMWLKGTPKGQLTKTFGKHFNVPNMISKHKAYLRAKRELFDVENVMEIFSTRATELV